MCWQTPHCYITLQWFSRFQQLLHVDRNTNRLNLYLKGALAQKRHLNDHGTNTPALKLCSHLNYVEAKNYSPTRYLHI
jgi:hypothetical protein